MCSEVALKCIPSNNTPFYSSCIRHMRTVKMSEELKCSFKSAFGVVVSSSKKEQLSTDIASVVLGFKPALIVDCGLTTVTKFKYLLMDILKNLNMREDVRSCCIAGIFDDVLFINLTALNTSWKTTKGIPRYINIDKAQTSPSVFEVNSSRHALLENTFSDVYEKLRVELCCYHSDTRGEDLDGETGRFIPVVVLDSLLRDFNLCTLFGRLLWYPVVYWFNPSNGYTLGMVPLIRYLVKVKKNVVSTTTVAKLRPDLFLQVSKLLM